MIPCHSHTSAGRLHGNMAPKHPIQEKRAIHIISFTHGFKKGSTRDLSKYILFAYFPS